MDLTLRATGATPRRPGAMLQHCPRPNHQRPMETIMANPEIGADSARDNSKITWQNALAIHNMADHDFTHFYGKGERCQSREEGELRVEYLGYRDVAFKQFLYTPCDCPIGLQKKIELARDYCVFELCDDDSDRAHSAIIADLVLIARRLKSQASVI